MSAILLGAFYWWGVLILLPLHLDDKCRLKLSSSQNSPALVAPPLLPTWLLAHQHFIKIQVTNLRKYKTIAPQSLPDTGITSIYTCHVYRDWTLAFTVAKQAVYEMRCVSSCPVLAWPSGTWTWRGWQGNEEKNTWMHRKVGVYYIEFNTEMEYCIQLNKEAGFLRVSHPGVGEALSFLHESEARVLHTAVLTSTIFSHSELHVLLHSPQPRPLNLM